MKFRFKENQTVDDLAKVPENFQAFYTKNEDGTFSVAEALAAAASAVDGLNGSLGQARGEAKAAREGQTDLTPLEEYGDDVTSIAENVAAQIATLTSKSGDTAKQLDNVRATLTAGHAKQLGVKDTRISVLDQALREQLVDSQLLTAIAAREGNAQLLLPAMRGLVKMSEAEPGKFAASVLMPDGTERFNEAGEPMTITQLVASMEADDSFAPCFPSSLPPGGGSKPGGNRPPRGPQHKQGDLSPHQNILAGLEDL